MNVVPSTSWAIWLYFAICTAAYKRYNMHAGPAFGIQFAVASGQLSNVEDCKYIVDLCLQCGGFNVLPS